MKVIYCDGEDRRMLSSNTFKSVSYIHVNLLVDTPAFLFLEELHVIALWEQES